MMMTQPFPAHQGIPQHAGLPPGHPMSQAQHPNMGVQGPGMVQQMHPGVSAAAGPQVSQPGPMMAGMPPGATTGPGGPVPNTHALQHLSPAQAHLLQQQQQQQQFGMNPANSNQLLQHQQAMARHQQRILAQQQQIAHHGGIPVSLPAGTQGLSQAQLSMQNPSMRGPVNMMHFQQQMPQLPPNIQQQQQQQFLAIQAQAHAAAQAQAQVAAQANNQQGQQHTPQQRAAVPPQSVTPQPQPGLQVPPGSATPSQQSNPPQHSTPQPPSNRGSQPPPQPTPNPQHQQIPLAQQALPQQQSQPQVQPNQQQPQQQPSQMQPQNGPQPTPHPQGQVQMTQQHQHAMSTPEHMKFQHQIMMEQQRRATMNSFFHNKGSLTQYVNSYFETLSNYESKGEDADLMFWQDIVNKYYNTTFHVATGQPWGVLRQGVLTAGTGSKSFEVNATILPRYYVTLFNNGIRRIQTHMEATQEFSPQNGYRVVFSPKVSFIYWFANDCQLFVNGSLKVLINPDFKFDLVDISVSSFREYIPRNLLQAPEPIEQKPSPRVTKNASKRMQQKQAPVPPTISPPESLVNENGLPHSVQCFLEIAETMSSMTSLIYYSTSNPQKNSMEVLRDVTSIMVQQSVNLAAQQQAQGQRTPSLNGPSQFASPSVGHMGLPGTQASPHLGNSAHPSPAQIHVMGPGAMPQQNQTSLAANGSQGPSANTSPNVSNKRRRPSTVKTEGDDVAEVNGAGPAPKVRASPKVGAGKRHKGNA